jgi:hypothetical protein
MPAFATSLALDRTTGRLNGDLLSPSSTTDPTTSIEITDDLHLRYLE